MLEDFTQASNVFSAKDVGGGHDREQENLLGVGIVLALDPMVAVCGKALAGNAQISAGQTTLTPIGVSVENKRIAKSI